RLEVLDAGCGTGLLGPLVRDCAQRLEGVDLSAAMIAMARQKNVYDALHESDLVAFMAEQPQAFDAVLSAATLIHFGDLHPVFAAAASALRDDGGFIFTLSPTDADETAIAVAGATGLAQGG